MAGKKSDLPGRKFSVWVSGENQQRLAEQGISPGEAIDRGLAAHDQVPVPDDVRTALRYLSRLAAAGANGRVSTAEAVPAELAVRAIAELDPPGHAGTLPPAVRELWVLLKHAGWGEQS